LDDLVYRIKAMSHILIHLQDGAQTPPMHTNSGVGIMARYAPDILLLEVVDAMDCDMPREKYGGISRPNHIPLGD